MVEGRRFQLGIRDSRYHSKRDCGIGFMDNIGRANYQLGFSSKDSPINEDYATVLNCSLNLFCRWHRML